MADFPIIFSGPMVRALLDGRKTMTRRLVPYGSVWMRVLAGDRLWVREAFHATEGFNRPVTGDCAHLFGYQEPGENREWTVPGIGRVREFQQHFGGWGGRRSKNCPSIHMPRWASRLTLTVTATKIERLQDISEDDARAEGASMHKIVARDARCGARDEWCFGVDERGDVLGAAATARDGFELLWERLHGAGSWDANPEVVAISFDAIRANIDAPRALASQSDPHSSQRPTP